MPSPATAATTLFSLGAVKTWLGLEIAEHKLDELLVRIADAVSARIEQATGWMFVTRTVPETWDGNDRDVRYLRARPIASVTSVTVDGAVVDASRYVLDGRMGRVALISGTFGRGRGNCTAIVQAGFAAQDHASLPQDIVQAGLDYVKVVHDEKTSGAIAASSISIGPAQMVLKPGLPPGIQAVLKSWKDTRA